MKKQCDYKFVQDDVETEMVEENVRSMWNPEDEDLAQIPALVESLIRKPE